MIVRRMLREIAVEEVSSIPNDAAVYHYDELDEELKHAFPMLVQKGRGTLVNRSESLISHGDYVKFTGFYRITF